MNQLSYRKQRPHLISCWPHPEEQSELCPLWTRTEKDRIDGSQTRQETLRGKKQMNGIGHINIDLPFCSARDVCLQQLPKRLKRVYFPMFSLYF